MHTKKVCTFPEEGCMLFIFMQEKENNEKNRNFNFFAYYSSPFAIASADSASILLSYDKTGATSLPLILRLT